MINYVQFTNDKLANRDALAEGVVGVECTYAGPAEPQDLEGVTIGAFIGMTGMTTAGLHPGTVERYANGARNIFIKSNKSVIGVIRVRP